MKEILKHFPDLEEGWEKMEEKLKTEPAEREMLSLKYREMLQRERLEDNLPEPEFTKAKRAESDSKVMETNKAPEKIYIHFLRPWLHRPANNESVEYTRTDAFIEKAQLFLIDKLKEIPMGNGKMKIKADCSLEDFIEDFKKAIKL